MRIRKNITQHGAALPLVLGVTAILGLMAATFVQTTRHNSLAARYSVQDIQLSHLARAASERGVADLLNEAPQIAQDGSPYRFALGRHTATVRIWDEKGKFDLNIISPTALTNLIDLIAAENSFAIDTKTIVVAINEVRLERRRNNETAFRSVYDLMQIPEIDENLYEAISPYLTVASYSPKVNLSTADEKVLRSLPGVTDADVDRVLGARDNGDAVALPSAAPWVTTASGPFYRVYSETTLETGQRAATDVTVWIKQDEAPIIIESRPVY